MCGSVLAAAARALFSSRRVRLSLRLALCACLAPRARARGGRSLCAHRPPRSPRPGRQRARRRRRRVLCRVRGPSSPPGSREKRRSERNCSRTRTATTTTTTTTTTIVFFFLLLLLLLLLFFFFSSCCCSPLFSALRAPSPPSFFSLCRARPSLGGAFAAVCRLARPSPGSVVVLRLHCSLRWRRCRRHAARVALCGRRRCHRAAHPERTLCSCADRRTRPARVGQRPQRVAA